MTDADRLRDAAQALMADVHPLCRTEGCSCQQERKVAALLRAVATDIDCYRDLGDTYAAALALADVILASVDE